MANLAIIWKLESWGHTVLPDRSKIGGKCIHIVWKSPKKSHLNFRIFLLLKLTCLLTLFDYKLQVFKNGQKCNTFGIFNELLSTQNVIVARFARNIKNETFLVIFKPLCIVNKAHKSYLDEKDNMAKSNFDICLSVFAISAKALSFNSIFFCLHF